MSAAEERGLCHAAVNLRPGQLVGLVCAKGGAACPLLAGLDVAGLLERLATDPTVSIRLLTQAEEVGHYRTLLPAQREGLRQSALDRKRDLDVLQKLGLAPGDTRRARYLYELLLTAITSPVGLCAYDSPGWSGCPLATSGAYEQVQQRGWSAMIFDRPATDLAATRREATVRVETAPKLHIRPHHLMCLACSFSGGEHDGPRPNDLLGEIHDRIRREPDIPVVLVEGQCDACDPCDGFHGATGRCVHGCGLVRDVKKDLDVFCRLGLLPGDELPARDLIELILSTITNTTQICGFGDGVVRSPEWNVCGGPTGHPGYIKTRATGLLAGPSEA